MTSISWVLERLTIRQKQGGGIPTVRPTRYFWHLLCHAFLLQHCTSITPITVYWSFLFCLAHLLFSAHLWASAPLLCSVFLFCSVPSVYIFSAILLPSAIMLWPVPLLHMFSIPVMFGTLVMFSTRVTHLLSLASLLCSLFALFSVLCYALFFPCYMYPCVVGTYVCYSMSGTPVMSGNPVMFSIPVCWTPLM